MRITAWLMCCALCLATPAIAQVEPPPPPPPPPSAECMPACRSGYMCSAGQCVSKCNPPCEAGARCLENGECAYTAPNSAPYTQNVAPVGIRVNQGWASGAGGLAIASAGVTALLTAVTILLNGTDAATYTGMATLLSAAVLVPIAAAGAASGRWDPRITGGTGWRVLGWITFGFAMSVGAVAVGLGIAGFYFPNYGIASLGALGVISALSFMADAFITASQGRALLASSGQASTLRHTPLFSLVPNPRGSVTATVGWAVVF